MELTVTRQVEGPGWFLKDKNAMLELLDRLDGWDGDVNKTDGAYKLILRQSGKNTITAPALHWIVPDGDELRLMDRAQFKDAGYQAADLPPEAEPDPPAAPETPAAPEQFGGAPGVDVSADVGTFSVQEFSAAYETESEQDTGAVPNA